MGLNAGLVGRSSYPKASVPRRRNHIGSCRFPTAFDRDDPSCTPSSLGLEQEVVDEADSTAGWRGTGPAHASEVRLRRKRGVAVSGVSWQVASRVQAPPG